MLSWTEIETRAVAFQQRWKGCAGDERQMGQTFEKDFMQVFGVDWLDGLHEHPITLMDGRPGYIDYLLPGKILIEMKSRGKSLSAAYTQAREYLKALTPEEQPVLLMVSDFDKVHVYNLIKEHPYKPFRVTQLKSRVRIFAPLAGYGMEPDAKTDIELNTDASYKMAQLHDALGERGYTGHELEVFLVRLLFCLFADDTGVFEKGSFEQLIRGSKEDGSDLSALLMELFSVLNTPAELRMKNMPEHLLRFRYINGFLFSEPLKPAYFTRRMREVLLSCCAFDWTQISPAIFGAMFQGVMDKEQRRELGAHYTSEENILKVINPLFLDALYDEFERSKNTKAELEAFHNKIASLTFLDPACGCGNFLIITYQKLRELEHEVLKLLHDSAQVGFANIAYTKVSLQHFYGIELEGFPVEIAKVSLLLMKHLMDQEISHYFGMNLIDFPIRDNANIVHGNALTLDWAQVVPPARLHYIIGNPPFVGYSNQSSEQKRDMLRIFLDKSGKSIRGAGKIDFVAAWYYKAAQCMQGADIRAAFVSTNSITQGDQVYPIWHTLFSLFSIEIDFAYRTFKWSNEAKGKAAVHCVIIGFSKHGLSREKVIFDEEKRVTATNINPYLVAAANVFIQSRSKPLCGVPAIITGNRPVDGGHLILDSEEYSSFIQQEPASKQYIRRLVGAREFINRTDRYCLWLVGVAPRELRQMPLVMERVEKVRISREASPDAGARQLAFAPALFREQNNPASALVIPSVSSEKRRYVPMGIIDFETIATNLVLLIPDASLYEFGVLTSNVHMAWMRAVAGRLKSDYRYSKDIVYNNFIWPAPTQAQRAAIEQTAQGILDARDRYPDDTYADLYDDTVMPPDLRRAHKQNDRAVWEAYGRAWPIDDESACVAHLMRLYQQATAK